ncbi:hypothetical protein PS1_034236 [Malus domestica]
MFFVGFLGSTTEEDLKVLSRWSPDNRFLTFKNGRALPPSIFWLLLTRRISNTSEFVEHLGKTDLHRIWVLLVFFGLTNHPIPSQLVNSAESEALSLFYLPTPQKQTFIPKSWPLGFEDDNEDDGDGLGELFCLYSSCSTESTELSLTSLHEFTRALEKVGLEVIELLCSSLGFQNPLGKDDPTSNQMIEKKQRRGCDSKVDILRWKHVQSSVSSLGLLEGEKKKASPRASDDEENGLTRKKVWQPGQMLLLQLQVCQPGFSERPMGLSFDNMEGEGGEGALSTTHMRK